MRLKIQGGTADNGEPTLCTTCRFAIIVRGRSINDEIIECSRLSGPGRITFAVASCSGYADRRQAALHEMEEIAWILRSDPKKNTIGFVKASEAEADRRRRRLRASRRRRTFRCPGGR